MTRRTPPWIGLPKTISENNIQLVMRSVGSDYSHLALRNRAILEVLYVAGTIPKALINIKMGDLLGGKLRIEHDTLTSRSVILGSTSELIIMDYIRMGRPWCYREFTDIEYLFLGKQGKLQRDTIRKITQDMAKTVGVKGISPRKIRWSFAKHLLENGSSIIQVCRILGFERNSAGFFVVRRFAAAVALKL